jgi:hypothetical protein
LIVEKRWYHHSIQDGPRFSRNFWTRYHGTPEGHDADGKYVQGNEREVGSVRIEFLYLQKRKSRLGLRFELDAWDLNIDLSLGRLMSAYVNLERWRPVMWLAKKLLPTNKQYGFLEERELSVSMHDGLFCWTLWREPHHFRSGDKRNGIWNWKDWLTGRSTMTEVVLAKGETSVPMPEGSYAATYSLAESTWTWPRFKRPKVMHLGSINVEGGIYVPGKGENSWDCGDDAIFSIGCPARTKEELIARYVQDVLELREARSGSHVKPAETADKR